MEVIDDQEDEGEASESSKSEISLFIKKPCIWHIPSRRVTFHDKILTCDKLGIEVTGKLAPNDRNTAFTPNFLPTPYYTV